MLTADEMTAIKERLDLLPKGDCGCKPSPELECLRHAPDLDEQRMTALVAEVERLREALAKVRRERDTAWARERELRTSELGLCVEVERLRRVEEALRDILDDLEHAPPNSGCRGYVWIPPSDLTETRRALDGAGGEGEDDG